MIGLFSRRGGVGLFVVAGAFALMHEILIRRR
jgi:hypothetical protein